MARLSFQYFGPFKTKEVGSKFCLKVTQRSKDCQSGVISSNLVALIAVKLGKGTSTREGIIGGKME